VIEPVEGSDVVNCESFEEFDAPWIATSEGDCAPSPSHTTGRAVFSIRRLNPAAYCAARSKGMRKPCLRSVAFDSALRRLPV
jgi:hypothetical protein